MPLRATFEPKTFKSRYQRNNKRGGLKNLRCFPLCGEEHKERGFCGRPVIVHLQASSAKELDDLVCWARFRPIAKDDVVEVGDVVAAADLTNQERSREFPLLPYVSGRALPKEKLEEVLESWEAASRATRPSAIPKNALSFGFNNDLKGWHYSWASNKHTCDSEHALVVQVYKTTSQKSCATCSTKLVAGHKVCCGKCLKNVYCSNLCAESGDHDGCVGGKRAKIECVGVFRSTPFSLFCRRRRRFALEPTAPVSEVVSRVTVVPTSASSTKKGKKRKAKAKRGRGFTEGSKRSKRKSGNESSSSSVQLSDEDEQPTRGRRTKGRSSSIDLNLLNLAASARSSLM